MQSPNIIKSIKRSSKTWPNKEETGMSVILFKAVHLTSSPLLGMKELNKYPNAMAWTK